MKNPQETIKKAYGILGFIKFLKGFYIIFITDKKKVAKIGRHKIYKIKDIKIIQLFRTLGKEGCEDENKYIQQFKDIQISKGFYFSYTYDITHSLQYNVLRQINNYRRKQQQTLIKMNSEKIPNHFLQNEHSHSLVRKKDQYSWDEKFVWNFYLFRDFMKIL